jgi:hypothetical protein
MADLVSNKTTSLPPDDVIVRAVQFFSTERWEATSQSPRSVTFRGKPPFPWLLIFFTIIGFMLCIIPGLIMYYTFIRKMHRFFNLVVTATATERGTQVTITHPNYSASLVERFLSALPAVK